MKMFEAMQGDKEPERRGDDGSMAVSWISIFGAGGEVLNGDAEVQIEVSLRKTEDPRLFPPQPTHGAILGQAPPPSEWEKSQ